MDHRSVRLYKGPKNLGLTWNGTSENSSSPTNMEKVLTMERPRWSKNFGFSSSSFSFFIVLASSECRRMKKPRPKAIMKREYLRWKKVFFLAIFDVSVGNNFKAPEQKGEEGGEDAEKHRGIDVAPGNKTEHGIENQIMYFPSQGQAI